MDQLNNTAGKNKRIILAGSGSGGPVAPLLAVAAELKKLDPSIEFLFVGTPSGPEEHMARAAGIKFVAIRAAKLRRYISLHNVVDVFVLLQSLFKSRAIIKDFKPDLIFSAGGFVAVPVSWVGHWMGVKIIIHQQDAQISLTNRLIAPEAAHITTVFEDTAKEMGRNAEWVGNPIRPEFFQPASPDAKKKFNLHDTLPILTITGGGTGADQINGVVAQCLPELLKSHQIIHITGRGKNTITASNPDYHAYEFLHQDMPDALKIADMVISRAGVSTISELSALGKISIIVPMPNSHQEMNASLLKEKAAAVVLNEEEFTPEELPRVVTSVKFNYPRQQKLIEGITNIMPHDAAARIAKIILKYV